MAEEYNNSGADSGYGDQSNWPASTSMARDTSHGSDYSDYSGSSHGQYNVSLSPAAEDVVKQAFFSTWGGGTYAFNEQAYEAGKSTGEPSFDYQYYNFITNGESSQEPYWQLRPGFTPSTDYPAMVPAEPTPEAPRAAAAAAAAAAASDTSGRHVCLVRFCNASPFRRKADLERHYLHKHRDASQKTPFPCDWKRCQRSREPFYRLDHLREHMRDYHNEDLPRRGPNKENNSDWWASRNVDPAWWRCAKCLARIPIDTKGFECAKCKTQCEPERRKLRGFQ
ncbi:hypothetical protein GGR52DRAFT_125098 [Hypoxylon sp. FL1284]|nr:hypothetical protein GGR52DRAFT_125098 [Hypoxylon sp. FL1284]